MFIHLTHDGSDRKISINVDSIDSIDAQSNCCLVRIGQVTIQVSEKRKQILEMIDEARTNKPKKKEKQYARTETSF